MTIGSTTPQSQPKRRKRLFRVLWSLLAIVVGVCGYWTWSYYSALAERDALIAEIHARGEPVWWNELADKVLAEQSPNTGAELFLKAIWEVGGDFNQAKPALPSSTLEDDLKAKYPEPTVLSEVEAELKAAAPAFALAEHAVSRKPGLLTKHLREGQPSAILLPHIQNTRGLQRMLCWETYDALAWNDPRRAYRSIILSLRCSDQLAEEPFLICQLVRFALKGVACSQLEMCLSRESPSDDEFRTIDGLLSAQDDGFNLHRALISERAMHLSDLENSDWMSVDLWNSRRARPTKTPSWPWASERWHQVISSNAGLPARLRTESEFLRLVDQLDRVIDKPNVDPAMFDDLFDDFVRRSSIHQLVENSDDFAIGLLRSFPRSVIIWHRRLIFARLALRLRRFYDHHGKFPDRLDDLCDKTMPKIRIDWFQNRPITYKHSAKGFRLETPESILKPEERSVLEKTPILSDYGLELELKK